MSLLNDALRKNRNEHRPEKTSLKAALPKLSKLSKPKRKLIWVMGGGLLLVIAAAGGFLLYWTESDVSSDFTPHFTASGISQQQPLSKKQQPVDDNPIASKGPGASDAPEAVKPENDKKNTSAVSKVPPKQKHKEPTSIAAAKPVKTLKSSKVPARQPPPKKVSKANSRKPAASKTRPRKRRPPRTRARASASGVHTQPLYQKARLYHRENRMTEAISLYQEVIKIDPHHEKARFNLAAAFLQTEGYSHAYPILADLYANAPDNQQVMLNLAIAHIGCHRFEKALQLLDKAGGRPKPPLFEIAFHKGVAYSHMNQMEKAVQWYKRAEAIRPNDPRLLFNLAVIFDQQQHYGNAIDYYRRHLHQSAKLDPAQERKIRRRIRDLRNYHTEPTSKEKDSL